MKIRKRTRVAEPECEPPQPQRKVYNPRRMRWEYEDGTPTDERTARDAQVSSQRSGRCGGTLKLWKSMPYGKYKDEYLCDIPTDYLEYVLNSHEDTGNGLHQSIELELNERHNGPERELLNQEEQERFDL